MTIQEKCEQYWNEHAIGDEEVHAVLEWIHKRADEVDAEIAQLREQARLREIDCSNQSVEIARLREALSWYGCHDDSCSFRHGKKCDCGFAEALKEGE